METVENPTVTFVRLALGRLCEAERRLQIKGKSGSLAYQDDFSPRPAALGPV